MSFSFLAAIIAKQSDLYVFVRGCVYLSCLFFLGCGGGGGGGNKPTATSSLSSSAVSSFASSLILVSSAASSGVTSSVSSSLASDIEILSTDGAGQPQVVMDSQGNAIAIWLKLNEDVFGYSLWSSRFSGGAWSEPIPLETDAGSVANTPNPPRIAIDPTTGKAAVVWTQVTSASSYDVWAKIYDPATGWATETRIETNDGPTARTEVGIDSSGNVIAVWSQDERKIGRFSIWANRYTPTGDWGTASLIEDNNAVGEIDGDPKIHMFATGEALVVWMHSGGSSRAIWANKFSGSAWGTAASLVLDSGANQTFEFPVVVGDATGSALLVWGQWDFVASKFESTLFYRPYQGAWQNTVTAISSPVESDLISRPIVSANASGNTIAVWGRKDNSIQASVRNISTWSTATPLKPADALEVLALPSAAADGVGNMLVAWVQQSADRLSQDVWINRYNNGSWSTSALAENLEGPAGSPSVAASLNGRSVLVWTHTEAGKGSRIYARYFMP